MSRHARGGRGKKKCHQVSHGGRGGGSKKCGKSVTYYLNGLLCKTFCFSSKELFFFFGTEFLNKESKVTNILVFGCLSVLLFFCLSVFLSFCLYVFLSFCLSVFLFFCLSVFMSFYYYLYFCKVTNILVFGLILNRNFGRNIERDRNRNAY